MPVIPVKNEDTAKIAAISIVIASARLLKNVSPPLCPEATREQNNMKNKREATISLTDQLPKTVFGL
jgi:hypothetical protein